MISDKLNRIKSEVGMLTDSCIVVEGIKDKIVLEQIGFKNIFDISNKSLFSTTDLITQHEFKSSVILTDFDEEGEAKLTLLTNLFRAHNITIYTFIRKLIKKLFGITKIEELKYFIKSLEDDYYGKVSSINDKIFNRSRFHLRRNRGETRCHRRNLWTNRGIVRTRS